jgi:hypothetical protein
MARAGKMISQSALMAARVAKDGSISSTVIDFP